MMPRSSLGVYFEGDRIDLVSLRRSFQGPHIKAALSLTLPQEGDEEGFLAKFRDFIKETKSERAQITLGLSRKETMLFSLDLPAPAEENLRRVIGYELDSISPYSSEEAYFDFQILARDEEHKTLGILLFVVPKKRLDACLKVLEKAKLQAGKVEISSTALTKAALYDRRDVGRGRRALLYAGKDDCEIILMDQGRPCYSRALPSRSLEETDDACTGLKSLLKHRGWDKASLDGVILSGDTEEDYTEIRKRIEAKMGCKTEILGGLEKCSEREGLSPKFTIPFGLSLEGLVKDDFPINLLPRAKEERRDRRRVQTLLPLVGLVLLLGGLLIATPWMQRKQVLDQLSQEIKGLHIENKALVKLEGEVEALEEKLDQLILLRGNRHKMLELTQVLTSLIPENTWLTDLRVKKGVVEMRGYSESSSSLIPLLEGSPLFGRVGFSAPVRVTQRRQAKKQEIGFDEDFDKGFDPDAFPFAEGGMSNPNPLRGRGIEEFKIKALMEETP